MDKEEKTKIVLTEMIEDLANKKHANVIKKHIPNQDTLEYLKTFRKGLYNKEGKSKGGAFAVVATFPIEVHVQMTNLHGNGWIDKPGVLAEFLQKNPHYRQGKPMDGLHGGLGQIKAGG